MAIACEWSTRLARLVDALRNKIRRSLVVLGDEKSLFLQRSSITIHCHGHRKTYYQFHWSGGEYVATPSLLCLGYWLLRPHQTSKAWLFRHRSRDIWDMGGRRWCFSYCDQRGIHTTAHEIFCTCTTTPTSLLVKVLVGQQSVMGV
jgi:hypothetical protein